MVKIRSCCIYIRITNFILHIQDKKNIKNFRDAIIDFFKRTKPWYAWNICEVSNYSTVAFHNTYAVH